MTTSPLEIICRRRASMWALLVVGLSLMGYGLWLSQQESPVYRAKEGQSRDIDLYQAVVKRMKSGEAYYDIVGEELRARDYAPKPFFNWRLPTMANFLAHLPGILWARIIALALYAAAVLAWIASLRREGSFRYAAGGGLLVVVSAFAIQHEQALWFHENWAGLLLLLSLGVRSLGRKGVVAAILCGGLALMIRELALPYVVIMGVLAAMKGRRREALGWFSAVAIFAVVLFMHAKTVSPLIKPDDLQNQWVAMGGWRFVQTSAVWNGALLLTPTWVTAIALPLSLLGALAWTSPMGLRTAATVFTYILAFAIAARPDNTYWGLILSPLLLLGLLRLPQALRLLWHSSTRCAES